MKYLPLDVKHHSINQIINQSINQSIRFHITAILIIKYWNYVKIRLCQTIQFSVYFRQTDCILNTRKSNFFCDTKLIFDKLLVVGKQRRFLINIILTENPSTSEMHRCIYFLLLISYKFAQILK